MGTRGTYRDSGHRVGGGTSPEKASIEQPCPHLTKIRIPSLGTADLEVGHSLRGRPGHFWGLSSTPHPRQEIVTAMGVPRNRPMALGGRISLGGTHCFLLMGVVIYSWSVNNSSSGDGGGEPFCC